MHFRFGRRGIRIELRRVRLHTHDRPRMRRQEHMRDLRQHRIRQVLHHQRHPIRLRPARRQQRPGLRLARLQRHARPTQLASKPHKFPIMRALVQEQRLAR